MVAASLPASFHLTTPHGQVGLWWLELPPGAGPVHAAQRQSVRQQAARILDRQFPPASLGDLYWPPGAMHPPNLAYATHSTPGAPVAPPLWLSWSYLPAAASTPRQALLAIGPLPIGVDVTAGSLLDVPGWAAVLRLYGGMEAAPPTADACAATWAGIEAADKCLRSGLREWSPAVAAQRRTCTLVPLPLAHPDVQAALAWRAPAID